MRVARMRIAREKLCDRGLNARARGDRGKVLEVRPHDVGRRGAQERVRAGEQLVQHDAESVEVRRHGRRGALQHFGGRVLETTPRGRRVAGEAQIGEHHSGGIAAGAAHNWTWSGEQ